MVVLSPFIQYRAHSEIHPYQKPGRPRLPDVHWVMSNLCDIVQAWEGVLDALDAKTALSVQLLRFVLAKFYPSDVLLLTEK